MNAFEAVPIVYHMGSRPGNLSDWQMAIVLTQYNNGHTALSAHPRPSVHYGYKFFDNTGIIEEILDENVTPGRRPTLMQDLSGDTDSLDRSILEFLSRG